MCGCVCSGAVAAAAADAACPFGVMSVLQKNPDPSLLSFPLPSSQELLDMSPLMPASEPLQPPDPLVRHLPFSFLPPCLSLSVALANELSFSVLPLASPIPFASSCSLLPFSLIPCAHTGSREWLIKLLTSIAIHVFAAISAAAAAAALVHQPRVSNITAAAAATCGAVKGRVGEWTIKRKGESESEKERSCRVDR